jgi:hypothetical protein
MSPDRTTLADFNAVNTNTIGSTMLAAKEMKTEIDRKTIEAPESTFMGEVSTVNAAIVTTTGSEALSTEPEMPEPANT